MGTILIFDLPAAWFQSSLPPADTRMSAGCPSCKDNKLALSSTCGRLCGPLGVWPCLYWNYQFRPCGPALCLLLYSSINHLSIYLDTDTGFLYEALAVQELPVRHHTLACHYSLKDMGFPVFLLKEAVNT